MVGSGHLVWDDTNQTSCGALKHVPIRDAVITLDIAFRQRVRRRKCLIFKTRPFHFANFLPINRPQGFLEITVM